MSPFASATCAFGMLVGFALVSTARQTRHPRHRRTDDEFSTSFLSEHERLAVIRRAAPDIAKYLPLSFDPSFDSPCFKDAKGAMQCLPAFFIAGGMQCGSDVLWQRLMSHGHIGRQHDGRSHWWTLHPRSRAGTFERYLSLFSNERTLATLQREPRTLLGEVSPATFAFMMAEMLRLHYLYLDAFSACHGRCRSRNPPPEHAALCARKTYDLAHCYVAANNATVPEEFNVPSLISTVLAARPPRVVALLREPSLRLWVAFWEYGQYPARYGRSNAGFAYYFGNQSAAFERCVATDGRGRRRCALRFEAYGAAEAGVYYHADQLVKGMYAAFLPEWQASLPRDHLLVMRSEDQVARPMHVRRRVASHLGLRPFTQSELHAARAANAADELEKVKSAHGLPEAAVLANVRAFYAPFNRALARQLGDRAFTWRRVAMGESTQSSTGRLE